MPIEILPGPATDWSNPVQIDPQTFRELLAYVRPKPGELRWQRIPWQTDLWAARRLAVEHRRPIFLWAMNGNPLGCT